MYEGVPEHCTSYLHNGSTLEHNSNRSRKLRFRATTFILAIFGNWSCDHDPNIPLNEPWQAESSSLISWLFGHTRPHFPFWEDPDMDPEGSASLCIHCIHQLYFSELSKDPSLCRWRPDAYPDKFWAILSKRLGASPDKKRSKPELSQIPWLDKMSLGLVRPDHLSGHKSNGEVEKIFGVRATDQSSWSSIWYHQAAHFIGIFCIEAIIFDDKISFFFPASLQSFTYKPRLANISHIMCYHWNYTFCARCATFHSLWGF